MFQKLVAIEPVSLIPSAGQRGGLYLPEQERPAAGRAGV